MNNGDPQNERKSPATAIRRPSSRGRQPRDGTRGAGRPSVLKRETAVEQKRRMLSAREHYLLIKQSEMLMDADGAFATKSRTSYASVGEKCIFWCSERAQHLSKKSLMHIFLLTMIGCYTVCGAIMFELLEGKNENVLFLESVESKRNFFQGLRKLGNEYTTNLSSAEEFDKAVFNLMREYYFGVEMCLLVIHKSWEDVESFENPWSFWNGIVFSATTYSTIGYGHVIPKTQWGRVATIVYAVIGIPLFLTLLAHLGLLLTKWIKGFWGFVRRCYYTGTCRAIRQERHVQQAVNTVSEFYEKNVYASPSSRSDLEDSVSTESEKDNIRKETESTDKIREKSKDLDAPKEKPSAEISKRVQVKTSVDKSKEKLLTHKSKEASVPVDPLKGRASTDNRRWPNKSKVHPSDSSSSTISITSSVSSTISSSIMFEDEFHLPITLGILILVAYIFLGAVIYMYSENWTYLDSVYFVFISMSTIGFGDYVPSHPAVMVCSIGYLVFGLSLTAMCINVAKIKINATFARARDRLRERIGIDV